MVAVVVHEPDGVEHLHRLVRVERRHDLRDRVEVAVDELAEAPVVVHGARPGATADEELEGRDAEGVLDVHRDEADPERVLDRRLELVLLRPFLRVVSQLLVLDAPNLGHRRRVEVCGHRQHGSKSSAVSRVGSRLTRGRNTAITSGGMGDLLVFLRDGIAAWLPLFFAVLLVLMVYILWRTLQVMPRVTASKTITSDARVSWDDVAGLDEAKGELREVIDFLTDPERFGRLGARVPKGILLYGPPGTGKTLLAKAIASEAGARFYAQSASAFVEMFAGLGAARIRKLFEEARKNAPAIVFIDELDAVGAQRTGHGFSREQDQTLNQLLVELDGFAARDQVIVMGASNRLQDLDTALLRPGRFDRQVLVAAPDLAGREQILKVHVRGKPLSPDVDLKSIARQTSGLTGAELENIANEAAIFAGRADRNSIRQADFEDAMERVVAGLQQRKVMTEKERRIIAYHEAGHAVMSHLTGDLLPVHKVTIVSRGQALGYTLNLPSEERYLHTAEEFADLLKVYLAGRAAEQIVFGRVTNGAANDLEKATEVARAMVFEYGMSNATASRTMRADNYALSEETKSLRDQEQARLTDEAYAEAIRLLQKHRPVLDRIAKALLEKETLDRGELTELIGDVEVESRASETVGTVRVVAAE